MDAFSGARARARTYTLCLRDDRHTRPSTSFGCPVFSISAGAIVSGDAVGARQDNKNVNKRSALNCFSTAPIIRNERRAERRRFGSPVSVQLPVTTPAAFFSARSGRVK